MFLVVVWAAASINFLVPQLAPGDPTAAIVARMESQGGRVENPKALIEEYRKLFGLDEPMYKQYFLYLRNVSRFELGLSIASFPTDVRQLIMRSLPWTAGLLLTTLVISFTLGSILGALMVWPRSSSVFKFAAPLAMVLAAIPYYLMALLLLFILAFSFSIFPFFGSAGIGSEHSGIARFGEILYYSTLPALSIIITSIGLWAITMRGLMVSTLGEDYLTLAEAKGLPGHRIFFWYGMRNAMLPQLTGLAIAVGQVMGGSVIVEVIFSYPGLGHLLFAAIQTNDYPVIQGITFLLVLGSAGAIFIMDLLYPRLDPRIRYSIS
jgi:peptide/nickel transport system permease protein